MNTWGASWGGCWGDTWGADDVLPPIPHPGGVGRSTRRISDEDDIETLLYIVAAAVAAGVIH